jgi:tetratricopeptide (TPR) repeat protein
MTQDGMPKKDKNDSMATKRIESLQAELEQNPRALSFPQLADLYLEKEMVDEAYDVLQKGLHFHPNSVSGMLILTRILKTRNHFPEAEGLLNKAVRLAPQNWQAYLMRADLFVRMGKHKQALADFKKVLMFNATHPVARKAVAKLEMITSDNDIDADAEFSTQSLQKVATMSEPVAKPVEKAPSVQMTPKLERILSLIDAFSMRQDYAKALKLLYECKSEFGTHPEIEDRLLKLSQYETAEKIRPKVESKISESKKALIVEKKQKALELLLRRVMKLQSERLVHN